MPEDDGDAFYRGCEQLVDGVRRRVRPSQGSRAFSSPIRVDFPGGQQQGVDRGRRRSCHRTQCRAAVERSPLSVVVVSYNVAPLLARCLDSILARPLPGMDVLVVDNASTDGSAALVRERYPGVTLLANSHNLGFGTACNQGLRRSRREYVLFVNPDAEVQGDSLAGMVRFLSIRPRAAVAGGRLRYADGTFQDSAFRFPSLAQVFLDSFPLNWRLQRSRAQRALPPRVGRQRLPDRLPPGRLLRRAPGGDQGGGAVRRRLLHVRGGGGLVLPLQAGRVGGVALP